MGRTTIVALFRDLATADRALQDLKNNGIDRQDVSLAMLYDGEEPPDETPEAEGSVPNGLSLGALAGSVTGLVMGLTTFVIPGVGPIIAAGPLAAALGGATGAAIGASVGAITGSLTGALVAIGVPDTPASRYSEAVSRGDTLLTVTVSGEMLDFASSIVKRYEPETVEYHRAKAPASYVVHNGQSSESQSYFNEPPPDRPKTFGEDDPTDFEDELLHD